jgi:hypothetical protein
VFSRLARNVFSEVLGEQGVIAKGLNRYGGPIECFFCVILSEGSNCRRALFGYVLSLEYLASALWGRFDSKAGPKTRQKALRRCAL